MIAAELEVSAPTASGIATYPPGATYGPRRMRDWEFVWLLEGDAEYRRDEDGRQRTAAAPVGSIVLCRPGATDFFRWDARQRTRHAYFHFQVECLPACWPQAETWPDVRLPGEGDILRPLFRHLLTWFGHNSALPNGDGSDAASRYDATIECKLTVAHLLSTFISGRIATSDMRGGIWPDVVERAWNYIHERVENQAAVAITLSELAAISYTTPEHLCRVFRAATGWSPMEALRLARLDRAATLLARSNYTVGEIADMCGFASSFHFSRRFKEAYGQSPRELRHAIRDGMAPPSPRLLQLTRLQPSIDLGLTPDAGYWMQDAG